MADLLVSLDLATTGALYVAICHNRSVVSASVFILSKPNAIVTKKNTRSPVQLWANRTTHAINKQTMQMKTQENARR